MPQKKKTQWRTVRMIPTNVESINKSNSSDNEEPEHFKYGIYYNDGYDYTKHLRSFDEYNQHKLDLGLDDVSQDDVKQIEQAYFPDSDNESLPKEVDLPSDDEMWGSDVSEMEDNFIELAGGHKTVHGPPKKSSQDKIIWNDSENPEKMLMMERFLWGNNEKKFPLNDDLMFNDDNASTVASSMRKGRPLNAKEELLEHQFDLTMRRTLNSNKNLGPLSVVSGCSFISEQLTNAMSLDTLKWKRLTPKTERILEPLAEEERNKFKEIAANIDEPTENENEILMQKALKDWLGEKGKKKDDVTTIASSSVNQIRKAQNLEMPISKKNANSINFIGEKMLKMSISEDENSGSESVGKLQQPESKRKTNETTEERKARKQALKLFRRQRHQVRKDRRYQFQAESAKSQRLLNVSLIKIDG